MLETLQREQTSFPFLHPQFGLIQVIVFGIDEGLGIVELQADLAFDDWGQKGFRFAVSIEKLLDRLKELA